MNKKVFLIPIVFSTLLLGSCHDLMKKAFWGDEPTYTDEQKEKYPQCDFDATIDDFKKSLDMAKNAYSTKEEFCLYSEDARTEVDDDNLSFAYFICDELSNSQYLKGQESLDTFEDTSVYYRWEHQAERSGIYTIFYLAIKFSCHLFSVNYYFSYYFSEYVCRSREKYYSLSDEQISSISNFVSKYQSDDNIELNEKAISEESA